jgi:hypothetical protein
MQPEISGGKRERLLVVQVQHQSDQGQKTSVWVELAGLEVEALPDQRAVAILTIYHLSNNSYLLL